MTIPQHPFRSLWQPIEINMVSYRLVDTIEVASLEAIHIFVTNIQKKLPGILLAYSLQ
jgi:hypothetical protein